MVYQYADVIAIVKTQNGAIVSTGDDMKKESRVVSKVLAPIKGTEQDAELVIYGGAAEINAEYMAILRWDKKVEGYRFRSRTMDNEMMKSWSPVDFTPMTTGISAEEEARVKFINERHSAIVEESVKSTLGFEGEMVPYNGWFYFPNCKVALLFDDCQRNFEQLQFMLKKLQEQKKPQ